MKIVTEHELSAGGLALCSLENNSVNLNNLVVASKNEAFNVIIAVSCPFVYDSAENKSTDKKRLSVSQSMGILLLFEKS